MSGETEYTAHEEIKSNEEVHTKEIHEHASDRSVTVPYHHRHLSKCKSERCAQEEIYKLQSLCASH